MSETATGTVLSEVKFNGVVYKKGECLEAPKETITRLIRVGVVQDPAVKAAADREANAGTAAAEAKAKEITDRATYIADVAIKKALAEAKAITETATADAAKVAEAAADKAKEVTETATADADEKAKTVTNEAIAEADKLVADAKAEAAKIVKDAQEAAKPAQTNKTATTSK
ncbi:hypothetical protein [Paeniglutamicibacter sp. NPDC091659]|uniref:hypothetical protein n=1 Tax=Paeniglutamicibacter sp. NPDC091659 TaxID=3364389 RepID=UPI00380BFEF7